MKVVGNAVPGESKTIERDSGENGDALENFNQRFPSVTNREESVR
jgi:hypothetical protein